MSVNGNGQKSDFLVKRSIPENFRWQILLGPIPKESSRTQDSEDIVNLGDLAFVSKLQQLKSEAIGKIGPGFKNNSREEKLIL